MSSQSRMRTVRRLAALIVSGLVAAAAARPAVAQNVCVGDCDASGAVFVNELVLGVNIALDQAPLMQCPALDQNENGSVQVNELIQGVANALEGCPATPTPSPTPLRVSHVAIAAGEEWRVPAGTTIVADDGMEISGDIVAEGRGGDLTLRAEHGDIVLIGGAIRFADGGEEQAVRSAHTTSAGAAAPLRPGLDVSVTNGGSTIVRADLGVVDLRRHPNGKLPKIEGQRGANGLGRSPSSWLGRGRQRIIKADDGGDGGDVIIWAGETGAELRLPTSVGSSEGPVIQVGSGGQGGDVNIEAGFDTDAAFLTVIGGKGGRSGRLLLQSITKVVAGPGSINRSVLTGVGGNGGYVSWKFSADANLEVAPLLPLVIVTMLGGRGGDGLRYGGSGAYAFYDSGYVINKRGAPITGVLLYGGNGGDVFGAPALITLSEVFGGRGAAASGAGNRGWNGGSTDEGAVFPNGARGGNITAVGGKGGDILGDVHAELAAAGAGGDCPPLLESGQPDFVLGGPGGNGRDTCDGCAGGNGGDSGNATAGGGAGGNISASAVLASSVPGNGGGVAGTYGPLDPGRAGNGNPPGKPGLPGHVTKEGGRGGIDVGIQGSDGQVTGSQNIPPQGEEGTACGEGSECTCAAPRADEPRATSALQVPGATCGNCCPVPCDESEPPNTGIRVLRFTQTTTGDGFSHTYQVIGAYNPCGQRDQFGNCQVKYTLTCSHDGIGYACTASDVAVLDLQGHTGGYLLGGLAFCHGVGNLCVGDGRECSLTRGEGTTSTQTWQCTNCGEFGPSCASEKYGQCQCLNFDHTGPGAIVVCPPPCFGPRCGR